MRYMVIYSHQRRNKEGKQIKTVDRLFKYVDAETKEEAKEIFFRELEDEERAKKINENRKFDRNKFFFDNRIIDIIK